MISLINPYRYGAGFVGPLDGYTTGLWSAVSVERLLSSFSGGSVNAVNTTSLATATIGFNADGSLDTASLATLAGANSVVITDFLNQYGSSSHGFAAAGTNRPTIVSAGAYLGHVEFDGSSDGMGTGVASGTPSAFTVFIRGKLRSTSGTQVYIEHSANYNANESALIDYDAGALYVGTHKSSPSGYSVSGFSGLYLNDNVHAYRVDRSQVTSAAQTVAFVNGSKQTRSTNADTGTLPTGNFGASNWFLGARNQASFFAQLNVHTLLIYESALSDSDVSSISSILSGL